MFLQALTRFAILRFSITIIIIVITDVHIQLFAFYLNNSAVVKIVN